MNGRVERPVRFELRLSLAERAELARQAASHGVSAADYLRLRAFGPRFVSRGTNVRAAGEEG